MGSGPNGCFTPRTYQHVNLGVAGIVLYDAPARVDLPRDLCRVRSIRHPGRDPGYRAGAGVALDTRARGTLPTSQYVPAAAPPLPLNV